MRAAHRYKLHVDADWEPGQPLVRRTWTTEEAGRHCCATSVRTARRFAWTASSSVWRRETAAAAAGAQMAVRWKFWKDRDGVGPRCPW